MRLSTLCGLHRDTEQLYLGKNIFDILYYFKPAARVNFQLERCISSIFSRRNGWSSKIAWWLTHREYTLNSDVSVVWSEYKFREARMNGTHVKRGVLQVREVAVGHRELAAPRTRRTQLILAHKWFQLKAQQRLGACRLPSGWEGGWGGGGVVCEYLDDVLPSLDGLWVQSGELGHPQDVQLTAPAHKSVQLATSGHKSVQLTTPAYKGAQFTIQFTTRAYEGVQFTQLWLRLHNCD